MSEEIRKIELLYASFLDDRAVSNLNYYPYYLKVENMIKHQQTRLLVKITDLKGNPEFIDRRNGLLKNSVIEITAFQVALKEVVTSFDAQYGRSVREFYIGLYGPFGERSLTPRTIHEKNFLNNTIEVTGVVTKISIIKPIPIKLCYYCSASDKNIYESHCDFSPLNGLRNTYKDKMTKDGDSLVLNHGLSLYKDRQVVTIQDSPNSIPSGSPSLAVVSFLEFDLVDKCKPGDLVRIVGSYRSISNRNGNFHSRLLKAVLVANYIELVDAREETKRRIGNFKGIIKLSKKIDIVDRMIKSLAPSIFGLELAKKALLLALIGGHEKILPNKTRLRGDINLLLLGDPSVAKSQLLTAALHCAARAVATTGSGSSGVGLTAAVTTDLDTGDKFLQAGATVLADRGVVCIDEFDKMSDFDKKALHEVMEQGSVSVCKAGINAKLNARCSILAAANPVYGYYNQNITPIANIDLEESLLSRFDLLLILLDEPDLKIDEKIASHVTKMHQDQTKNKLNRKSDSSDYNRKILPLEILRKYIELAKTFKPQLTEEARSLIASYYTELRDPDQSPIDVTRVQPITVRVLDTLIRLSTAHAKARLDNISVNSEDVQVAFDLVKHCLFHSEPGTSKRRNLNNQDSDIEMRVQSGSGKRRRVTTVDVVSE